MDVFIPEDYVKRRHEIKRKKKKLTEVQVYQRVDSINSSSSPRSPGESFPPPPPPPPVVKIKSQREGASIAPSFDSIYHCFTP